MLNRTPLTLLLLAGCLALPFSLHAQPTPDTLPPKREFRALWVASVNNLDFPSRPGLDAAAFQAEWEAVLQEMAEAHFNAVIVQLRPAGDALYPSKLAPWSAFLAAGQGQAPQFDFDPLDWMIRRAHDYGLEFHAWLNPLRGGLRPDTSGLASWHPARLHPEWVVPYNNRLYFNPGLEPVRQMVVEVVEELVTHYDVDAVHFDDYFYPYKVSGQHFNDSLSYFQQHQPGQSVSDWRRQNIDRLIEGVSRKLRAVAPEVRFGVSPFGVWRNEVQDPLGSPTTSPTTAYDDLYANTLRWLENGWVDYVIPQLYWSTEDPANPFGRLLTWWSEHSFERELYIGHALYKIGNDADPAWRRPEELPRQMRLCRAEPRVQGNAFFNLTHWRRNALGAADSIRGFFQYPALMPVQPAAWEDLPAPPVLLPPKLRKGKLQLRWTQPAKGPAPKYFILYRFEGEDPGNFDHPKFIRAVIPNRGGKVHSFEEDNLPVGRTFTYVLTAANQFHAESDLSNVRTLQRKGKKLKLLD